MAIKKLFCSLFVLIVIAYHIIVARLCQP